MSKLLALDLAIVPPLDVRDWATELSAKLPAAESKGLRLDEEHLPHVTLTQQFVYVEDLERIFTRVDGVLRGQAPLTLHVTGSGKSASSAVWIAIERTATLVGVHEHLMEALDPFEQRDGGRTAFAGGDARVGDVVWVAGYRTKASLNSFSPHITLGHARQPPHVQPFIFTATTIAACHLGRFCTCRLVLRRWDLA